MSVCVDPNSHRHELRCSVAFLVTASVNEVDALCYDVSNMCASVHA